MEWLFLQHVVLLFPGNIGSGKTTLFQHLQIQRPHFNFIAEPIDKWTAVAVFNRSTGKKTDTVNLLQQMYNETVPTFLFQIHVHQTKMKCLEQIQPNATNIFERSVHSARYIFLN